MPRPISTSSDRSIITSLDATALDLPLHEPFAIASGSIPTARNVLFRVGLADGTIGLGESAPFPAVSGETQERVMAVATSCRDLLLGKDAAKLLNLSKLLLATYPEEPAARAGLEQALLDAQLRQCAMPMWRYFGGDGTSLVTDITITASDRQHAINAAQSALRRGFTSLKIKVGALSPTEDAERIYGIHKAARTQHSPVAATSANPRPLNLILDANGGYTAEQALELLAHLDAAAIPIALFEQPVAREDQAGLLEVSRRTCIPICADESARNAAEVLWLIQNSHVQAINLKLMKSGLFETLAMYHVAKTAGMRLMIGGMVEGPLAMGVAAHLAAGLGGFSFVDLDTALFVSEHPFSSPEMQQDAHWDLARVTAGHGITLVSSGI